MYLKKGKLLKHYWIIVRSKCDYGELIYGATKPSYPKTLTIPHQELRVIRDNLSTSPVVSLYIEASEPLCVTEKAKANT